MAVITLNYTQRKFLQKVVKLHDDISNTYLNSRSIFTFRILNQGEYMTSDSSGLNKVGIEYKEWIKNI